MPERIQLRRTRGWRKPEGAVVVARPSRWGNPFRVQGGTVYGPDWTTARNTWRPLPESVPDEWSLYITSSSNSIAVEHAVEIFRRLINVRRRDEADRLRQWLAPLAGRDLACWCPLDQPCHASVLLEIANS